MTALTNSRVSWSSRTIPDELWPASWPVELRALPLYDVILFAGAEPRTILVAVTERGSGHCHMAEVPSNAAGWRLIRELGGRARDGITDRRAETASSCCASPEADLSAPPANRDPMATTALAVLGLVLAFVAILWFSIL